MVVHFQDSGAAEPADVDVFDPNTRQGQIGLVATDLFYEKGFHATGMREIAKHLGGTVANIYNFFQGKEELLYFVLEAAMTALLTQAKKSIDPTTDPATQLRDVIHCHILFHAKNQKASLVSDSELRGLRDDQRQRILDHRDQYERIFRAILSRGVETGHFRPLNPKLRAMGIILMCTGVAYWYRPSGTWTPECIANDYCEFVMEGLLPSATAAKAQSYDGSRRRDAGKKDAGGTKQGAIVQ